MGPKHVIFALVGKDLLRQELSDLYWEATLTDRVCHLFQLDGPDAAVEGKELIDYSVKAACWA